jgi:hypothetical protein
MTRTRICRLDPKATFAKAPIRTVRGRRKKPHIRSKRPLNLASRQIRTKRARTRKPEQTHAHAHHTRNSLVHGRAHGLQRLRRRIGAAPPRDDRPLHQRQCGDRALTSHPGCNRVPPHIQHALKSPLEIRPPEVPAYIQQPAAMLLRHLVGEAISEIQCRRVNALPPFLVSPGDAAS